jgi:hypothetical protein
MEQTQRREKGVMHHGALQKRRSVDALQPLFDERSQGPTLLAGTGGPV